MKSLESTNLISKYHIVFKMEYHSIIHWTPLHIATDRNYYEIAQLLIKQKRIDINLKDKIFSLIQHFPKYISGIIYILFIGHLFILLLRKGI